MAVSGIVIGSAAAVTAMAAATLLAMLRRRYSRRLAALLQARLRLLTWRWQQMPPGNAPARVVPRPNPTARPAVRTLERCSTSVSQQLVDSHRR